MCFEFLYKLWWKHLSLYEATNEIRSKISHGLHEKCPLLVSDFNEASIFYVFFRKYPNINSQEIPSSVRRVVPCRQTDRHDEAKSRFSQFCERAKKHVKCTASTKTLTTLTCRFSFCSQVDWEKKKFCLYLPFVFPNPPLASCFLISSKSVLKNERLKSAGKSSI